MGFRDRPPDADDRSQGARAHGDEASLTPRLEGGMPIALLLLLRLHACGVGHSCRRDHAPGVARFPGAPNGARSAVARFRSRIRCCCPALRFAARTGISRAATRSSSPTAPVFARQWIAEPSLYQVTTPVVRRRRQPVHDAAPAARADPDDLARRPTTGARRFVVPLEPGRARRRRGTAGAARSGGRQRGGVRSARTRASIAVRTDGTIVWDVPTGLGDATTPAQSPIGLAWVPTADADRRPHARRLRRAARPPHRRTALAAPLQLPGERTPPRRVRPLPPALAAQVDELLAPLVAFHRRRHARPRSTCCSAATARSRTTSRWIRALGASGSPRPRRDDEDGTADGVSELGALYRIDVVPRAAPAAVAARRGLPSELPGRLRVDADARPERHARLPGRRRRAR